MFAQWVTGESNWSEQSIWALNTIFLCKKKVIKEYSDFFLMIAMKLIGSSFQFSNLQKLLDALIIFGAYNTGAGSLHLNAGTDYHAKLN